MQLCDLLSIHFAQQPQQQRQQQQQQKILVFALCVCVCVSARGCVSFKPSSLISQTDVLSAN